MKSTPTWHYKLILFVAAVATAPNTQSFTPTGSFSTIHAKHVTTKLYTTTTDKDLDITRLKESLLSNAEALSLTSESYAPSSWSNRFGTVLTPASHPSVYTADRPFYWNNIDVGGRMTVIQLSATAIDPANGQEKPQLWIHSPVDLEDSLRETLEQLGVVTHVVSPNYEHVKYAQQWGEAFPNAYMWACPGMMEKEPQVRWTGEIPFGARPFEFPNTNKGVLDAEWDDRLWDPKEIQPCHFDTEVNPFTNKAFFNEVVFYHTPSKTMLTTDIYWNYPAKDGITNSNFKSLTRGIDFGSWKLAPSVPSIPFGSSLWKTGMDKIYLPFYLKLMVRKYRDEFQTLVSYISGINEAESGSEQNGWQVETLVPCHGDIVRGEGLIQGVLKQHFNLNSAST